VSRAGGHLPASVDPQADRERKADQKQQQKFSDECNIDDCEIHGTYPLEFVTRKSRPPHFGEGGEEENGTDSPVFLRAAQRGHTSQKPVVLAGEV